MQEAILQPQIISVAQLLKKPALQIPPYQRPYKWQNRQVNQLLDDLFLHKKKSAYRLGTLVFHQDSKARLNIVDGQQRTLTLLLIALAIFSNEGPLSEVLTKAKIKPITSNWFQDLKFSSSTSQKNLQANYRLIKRRVAEFDPELVRFFYEKCQLVEVVLSDITEAFQFFDSQNSRGRDLAPHDLLKAFHLREMEDTSNEKERGITVKNWEKQDSQHLQAVFSQYLYRIRNWSRGQSARFFTKDDVHLFKGLSPNRKKALSLCQAI